MSYILTGDCLVVMPTLEAESVDAIVSDPPYGLAFMGKAWDHGVPGPEFWREAWRVAKPGAHLVAFGGTRTYHRLTCAIEDAGWEIRDCLSWLYGSGFPKSLDVSKAMDKAAPRVGMFDAFAGHFKAMLAESGLSQKEVSCHFPSKSGGLTGCVWNWANGANVPTRNQWDILAPMLNLSDEWLPLIERIEAEREVVGHRRQRGSPDGVAPFNTASAPVELITAPATALAREWQGWGTALKPAWEPIILARKPLTGTVASNVAQHGTGSLNVDGCRIGTDESLGRPYGGGNAVYGKFKMENGTRTGDHLTGRWPANVCLDEEAAAMLDAQTGNSTSTDRPRNNGAFKSVAKGAETARVSFGHSDSGGASRFFYVAKASRREREAGLEGMPEREAWRHNQDGRDTSNPANVIGAGAKARVERGESAVRPAANHHPTVKPIALMRWLCRLVTPKGGLILDPFTGSGTTGCAAVLEGFRFVGIEREPEYAAIAEKRIAHWAGQVDEPTLFG